MSKMKTITLLNEQTSNITGTPVNFDGDTDYCDLYITGNFGGATVEIQAQPTVITDNAPSVGFTDIAGAEAITQPVVGRLDVVKNTNLRAVVTNATGTTNISIIAKYYVDIY